MTSTRVRIQTRERHLLLVKPVESRIVILRGHKVMLDSELAELYGVRVKALERAS